MWSRNWGKDLNASHGRRVGRWDRKGQAGNEERVVKPITSVDNYYLTPLLNFWSQCWTQVSVFPTRRGKSVPTPSRHHLRALGKGIDILVLLVCHRSSKVSSRSQRKDAGKDADAAQCNWQSLHWSGWGSDSCWVSLFGAGNSSPALKELRVCRGRGQLRVIMQCDKCLGRNKSRILRGRGCDGWECRRGGGMLPGRDEADLMRRQHKGEKVKTTFSKQADLCVQMYEGTRGHFDKRPFCLVFHSMHSLLLREAFLQRHHTVRPAHYWMSNALNKFYYFMLDVWGYPLISDSYYPETKNLGVNIFFSLKKKE